MSVAWRPAWMVTCPNQSVCRNLTKRWIVIARRIDDILLRAADEGLDDLERKSACGHRADQAQPLEVRIVIDRGAAATAGTVEQAEALIIADGIHRQGRSPNQFRQAVRLHKHPLLE